MEMKSPPKLGGDAERSEAGRFPFWNHSVCAHEATPPNLGGEFPALNICRKKPRKPPPIPPSSQRKTRRRWVRSAVSQTTSCNSPNADGPPTWMCPRVHSQTSDSINRSGLSRWALARIAASSSTWRRPAVTCKRCWSVPDASN